jgi:hypothetical protein
MRAVPNPPIGSRAEHRLLVFLMPSNHCSIGGVPMTSGGQIALTRMRWISTICVTLFELMKKSPKRRQGLRALGSCVHAGAAINGKTRQACGIGSLSDSHTVTDIGEPGSTGRQR